MYDYYSKESLMQSLKYTAQNDTTTEYDYQGYGYKEDITEVIDKLIAMRDEGVEVVTFHCCNCDEEDIELQFCKKHKLSDEELINKMRNQVNARKSNVIKEHEMLQQQMKMNRIIEAEMTDNLLKNIIRDVRREKSNLN